MNVKKIPSFKDSNAPVPSKKRTGFYLSGRPPSAIFLNNSRVKISPDSKTTDDITIPISQNLGNVGPVIGDVSKYSDMVPNYLSLKSQRTVLERVLEKIDQVFENKDLCTEVKQSILDICNATYATLFDESAIQCDKIHAILQNYNNITVKSEEQSLLSTIASVLITILRVQTLIVSSSFSKQANKRIRRFSSVSTLESEISDNRDEDEDLHESIDQIQNINTSDNNFICRICEQVVPLDLIEKHSSLCIKEHQTLFHFYRYGEQLKVLRSKIANKYLDQPWPGDQQIVLCIIFPILQLFSLISLAIEISNANTDGLEQLQVAVEALTAFEIPEDVNQLISLFVKARQICIKKLRCCQEIVKQAEAISLTTIGRRSSHAGIRTHLSDFSIIGRLSSGAFARVYLSKKKKTGDLYAIKVIKKANMNQKNQIRAVSAERDIMRCLHSPFIVNFYYSFVEKNNLYLVMEYIPGGDIFTLLQNVGSLDEDNARIYTVQIVKALQFLQMNGIVHRDIKPDNVLITAQGRLKLADFGLSYFGVANQRMSSTNFNTFKVRRAKKKKNCKDFTKMRHNSLPDNSIATATETANSDENHHVNESKPTLSDPTSSILLDLSMSDQSIPLGITSSNESNNDINDQLSSLHRITESNLSTDSYNVNTSSISTLSTESTPTPTSNNNNNNNNANISSISSISTDSIITADAINSNNNNNNSNLNLNVSNANAVVVGTPDYMAPEVIKSKRHTYTADYWSLGCVVFEMLTGIPPFHGVSEVDTFRRILIGAGCWEELDEAEVSDTAKDFIHKLLTVDPLKRLGSKSIDEIMHHPWFDGIDWENVEQLDPVFVPDTSSLDNYKNYFSNRYSFSQRDENDIIEDMEESANEKSNQPPSLIAGTNSNLSLNLNLASNSNSLIADISDGIISNANANNNNNSNSGGVSSNSSSANLRLIHNEFFKKSRNKGDDEIEGELTSFPSISFEHLKDTNVEIAQRIRQEKRRKSEVASGLKAIQSDMVVQTPPLKRNSNFVSSPLIRKQSNQEEESGEPSNDPKNE